MSDSGPGELDNPHDHLDWIRDVAYGAYQEAGSARDEGFALGTALTTVATIGVIVWYPIRSQGMTGAVLAAGAALLVAGWWLVRGMPVRASGRTATGTWPVQFVVHELGAEAIPAAGAPAAVAVALLAELRSRAAPGSFWSGFTGGVGSSNRVMGEWWEQHRIRLRKPDADRTTELALSLEWQRVTAVAVDDHECVIDLAGAGSPGVRLHCHPETFAATRTFVRHHLSPRFWSALAPPPEISTGLRV